MAEGLGALLRDLRTRSGMTQDQLAERSGLSERTIRRLENDRGADPRLSTVNLLADALGAGPEERRRLAETLSGGPAVVPEPAPTLPEEADSRAARRPRGWERTVLAEAAEELAAEVLRRLRQEEGQRRVHDPYALPVRWSPAAAELTDRPENVRQLAPGVGAAPELDLDGDLHSVAAVYRRVESGRLVVLGRGGSGKSILAIRFVLDLLAAEQPLERVPVVFSLGSWDPSAVGLPDWLTDRLLRDHPDLARRLPSGRTLAAELIGAELVLPVLDGFDELAEGLRPEALRVLNLSRMPMVLTSRRSEYAEAVEAARAPLVWAAGIELADLTLTDLDGYLPRTVRPAHRPPVWDGVLAELHTGRAAGSQGLATALRTPLFVGLARTMYSEEPGSDPGELLDAVRFPDAHAVEEHLLAGFVPTVYRSGVPDRVTGRRREWDADRARHWLGHLAHHLARLDRERQDLAWWQLGDSAGAWARVLATFLVTVVSVCVAEVLVMLVVLSRDPLQALLDCLLVGPVAGFAFGAVHAVLLLRGAGEFEPARTRWSLRRADRSWGRLFRSRFVLGLAVGFLAGCGVSCTLSVEQAVYGFVSLTDPVVLWATLINMLLFGLMFGLVAGLGLGCTSVLEVPLDVTSAATPADLLAVNRATVIRQFLVLAPASSLGIALSGKLVVWLGSGLLGPLSWPLDQGLITGSIGGIGGSLAYAFAFTAWGRWVVLARCWLPLTRRLPWRTVEFLDDAYRRGVLRRAGAVYQFRHLRLQHHLGAAYRAGRSRFSSVHLDG
ncbi:XRE family transcriptional regulator [Kitasatospora sp. MMS16-BH015]|uniref:helix-turn-helix domain-containing protein n=1 Tax=Kitasatospora sp. MMS16-BH015 TaxID=2018025 RepID=UPI000CA21A25|nr:helix-turn-helix domain-containing protein [Kitasatospora sp. MMS16-BH015]AUG79447.1 XRE family transcriptional regulator [Kitasatospora sp. MMS16-BH015]